MNCSQHLKLHSPKKLRSYLEGRGHDRLIGVGICDISFGGDDTAFIGPTRSAKARNVFDIE
jgi:hypothetical protein